MFFKNTHNQKYCTPECCRVVTNLKLMERYYDKKSRRDGLERECKTDGCHSILSRYNDQEYCSSCIVGRTPTMDSILAEMRSCIR